MTGPTNNPNFNETLAKWASDGHAADPNCEECDANMTGQDVFDTGTEWVCSDCFDGPRCSHSAGTCDECGDFGDF